MQKKERGIQSLPPVSINIVTYDGAGSIASCLDSLTGLKYPNYRVLVIDNASTDNTVSLIKSRYPWVEIIQNGSNLGFGEGHNIGIRHALSQGTKYVWLLNQDAWVAPDSLSRLVGYAVSEPRFGAASPIILNPNGSVWFAGGSIDWLRMRAIHSTPETIPSNPYVSDYLTGCALFLGHNALKQDKCFDGRFFLYYEDADLSLRLRAQGLSLSIVPSARIWHTESSNERHAKKSYWLVRSGLMFFRKHATSAWRLWYSVFVPLRRLKNLFDTTFRPNEINRSVRDAYVYRHSDNS